MVHDNRGQIADDSGFFLVFFFVIGALGAVMIFDALRDLWPLLTAPIPLLGTVLTYLGLAFGALIVALLAFGIVITHSQISGQTRDCECAYVDPEHRSEKIETTEHWRRREDGAKVVWERVARELRRCEECGKHYYVDAAGILESREAWPEEEPEIMPDDEALVDAEWN
jgi:hypothetical protein